MIYLYITIGTGIGMVITTITFYWFLFRVLTENKSKEKNFSKETIELMRQRNQLDETRNYYLQEYCGIAKEMLDQVKQVHMLQ